MELYWEMEFKRASSNSLVIPPVQIVTIKILKKIKLY